MISTQSTTQKCPYMVFCNYADSAKYVDNYCGCINKEEAENPSKSRQGKYTFLFMAKVFTCTLKESRAGMPKGTTIQVATNFSTPADYEIGDECERRFGKKARDAQFKGYWTVKEN